MLECWTENRFKPIAEVLVSSVETETEETTQAPMLGFEEWFLLGQRTQKNSGLWPVGTTSFFQHLGKYQHLRSRNGAFAGHGNVEPKMRFDQSKGVL
jgi:hypothetical protein